jgi:hypothetical protein
MAHEYRVSPYLVEHPSQLDGIVYVAHPIGGDVENNAKCVLSLLKALHSGTCTPIAPYLVCLQYLDDANPADRAKGIAANALYFQRKVLDLLLLCGPKISTGMTGEVKLALQHNIPIKCHNPALVLPLDELVRKHQAGPP